jgi:hypothetical protein
MTKFSTLGVACLAAALGLAGTTTVRAEDGLFASQVQIDSSEIVAANAALVAAFIPTGSDSEVCFVNLGDSGFYLGSFDPPTCIRRTYAGQKGVVVILRANGWNPPPNFVIRVSVYQKGARSYGQPVPYLG